MQYDEMHEGRAPIEPAPPDDSPRTSLSNIRSIVGTPILQASEAQTETREARR